MSKKERKNRNESENMPDIKKDARTLETANTTMFLLAKNFAEISEKVIRTLDNGYSNHKKNN